MSGSLNRVGMRYGVSGAQVAVLIVLVCCVFLPANAQQRREREPNSVYTQRRARLAATADGPIVLMGYTGREEESEAYIFAQEENFYYLTGHNEEEAALVLLPLNANGKRDDWQGAREILAALVRHHEEFVHGVIEHAAAIAVDGQPQGLADTSVPSGSPREAQQVLFSTATLAAGNHVLQLTKNDGTYMTIDAFRVQP